MRCAIVLTCLFVVFGFGAVWAGDLEPSAPPGPTMKSLDEIAPTWSRHLDSTNGEPDGCNSDRFKCVLNDEAVLDMETGLVWQRSPENAILNPWEEQVYRCFNRSTGDRGGWRMPTAFEFMTLLEYLGPDDMGLPPSHPFDGVLSGTTYVSITSDVPDPTKVLGLCCLIPEHQCGLCVDSKAFSFPIWCVRGGRGDASP